MYPLVQVGEFQLPALVPDRGVSLDQFPDSRTIDVLDFAQVQHDRFLAVFRQIRTISRRTTFPSPTVILPVMSTTVTPPACRVAVCILTGLRPSIPIPRRSRTAQAELASAFESVRTTIRELRVSSLSTSRKNAMSSDALSPLSVAAYPCRVLPPSRRWHPRPRPQPRAKRRRRSPARIPSRCPEEAMWQPPLRRSSRRLPQ